MNNATCVAKYEDGDYQCACAAGYVGKHCEIGISTHQFGLIDFFIITYCYTLPIVISSFYQMYLGLNTLQLGNNWMTKF